MAGKDLECFYEGTDTQGYYHCVFGCLYIWCNLRKDDFQISRYDTVFAAVRAFVLYSGPVKVKENWL